MRHARATAFAGLFVAVVGIMQPDIATAQTAEELYKKGVAARLEQRFDDAAATLEEAATLEPENADIFVQLGFALLGKGDLDAAEHAFDRTLEIAPDYQDARFGLASIAFRRGRLATARQLAETVVAAQPGNADAANLIASLDKADRAARRRKAERARRKRARLRPATAAPAVVVPTPPQPRAVAKSASPPPSAKKWRLDLGSEYSDLTAGRGSWTDSAGALSYRMTPATTVSGSARVATRYGNTDTQVQLRIDHAFRPSFSTYASLAVTPHADFLARYSFAGGASWRAVPRRETLGPLYANVDLRHDIYPQSRITTISPGLQYFIFSERLGISARWIHSTDHESATSDGYLARLDLTATDRLRLFAGYADAPEISKGTLVETRALFAGLSFDATDALTIRASIARETRDAFDRNTIGGGVSLRF